MDTLPQDPFMLMSVINMKLRDGGHESLEELCAGLDIDPAELKECLAAAGFEYLPEARRFV